MKRREKEREMVEIEYRVFHQLADIAIGMVNFYLGSSSICLLLLGQK